MVKKDAFKKNPHPNVPRPWQPRFGLGTMFMIMLIACVMAAAGFYLVKAIRGGASFGAISIVMAMAAPALLMVFVSLLRSLIQTINERQGPDDKES
jgi:hypothetical protein